MATVRDKNRYKKIYPLLRRRPIYETISLGNGVDVEAATITFNNSSQETYTFTSSYVSLPVCTISPEDDNVNIFITSLTTLSVTISASEEFSGKVHIHVVSSDN